MTEKFLGEIRMFAGNFAPRDWAFCEGQLFPVSQNELLFSLLGTAYGGDGQTNFGLPDLRGRIPVHAGSGPGLSPRRLGANGGAESVTLTVNQIPSHNHGDYHASTKSGNQSGPAGNLVAGRLGDPTYRDRVPPDTNMSTAGVAKTGGSQRHTNLMPFLCIAYIIAIGPDSIYPSRQ